MQPSSLHLGMPQRSAQPECRKRPPTRESLAAVSPLRGKCATAAPARPRSAGTAASPRGLCPVMPRGAASFAWTRPMRALLSPIPAAAHSGVICMAPPPPAREPRAGPARAVGQQRPRIPAAPAPRAPRTARPGPGEGLAPRLVPEVTARGTRALPHQPSSGIC